MNDKNFTGDISAYEQQFEDIRLIIEAHKHRAYRTANSEQIASYWEIGAYISAKLKNAQWGSKIVNNLAKYLKSKQADLKGFDKRALYRMVQFFNTYSDIEFIKLLEKQETIFPNEIVGNETPQFDMIENVQK
jgi:hypothetical protein